MGRGEGLGVSEQSVHAAEYELKPIWVVLLWLTYSEWKACCWAEEGVHFLFRMLTVRV